MNRTFRNKQDGLMVGYASLHENLLAALAEYTSSDQQHRPMGRDLDDALVKVRDLVDVLGNILLAGYPWRENLRPRAPRVYRETVLGATNYLRDPPLNQSADPEGSGRGRGVRLRAAAGYRRDAGAADEAASPAGRTGRPFRPRGWLPTDGSVARRPGGRRAMGAVLPVSGVRRCRRPWARSSCRWSGW